MNERVTYRTVRHEAYVGASRVELYVLSLSPFFFPFCSVNVLVSLIEAAVFSSITSGYHSVFSVTLISFFSRNAWILVLSQVKIK